jgi:Conjugative transposon protein TcpC
VRLSKTWKARLLRWRLHSKRGGVAALVAAAILGAAAAGKLFLAPDRPNVVGIAQRVGNQADQVGAFASDFVVSWLTATSGLRGTLSRFITVPDNMLTLPATPAAVVTNPQVVSVINVGAAGDADLYAATVSVNERPYASAQSTRAFFRVPVSMWGLQPRALALPAQVNGPGPGADFKLGYPQILFADSPVYAVVSGFIRTYLTATTGLDRYVLAGTPLAPVGGYQSAVVSSATADRAVPDNPGAWTQVRVLAAVTAQTPQFATVNLVYPLTVENSAGTWMVAAIDLVPQIGSDADASPVGPNGNSDVRSSR